jgi:hypothetical protein
VAATAIVLWLAHSFERTLIQPLIPVFCATIGFLDNSFIISDARLNRYGPNETVSFQANLARPTSFAETTLYPFGSGNVPPGYAQVDCTLGGVFEYAALILIVSLAWPARRVSEFVLRLLICVPFLLLILMMGVPTTVIAELWNSFEQDANVHVVSNWMVWSRFLMGGGGFVLAMVFAGTAVSLAAWLTSRVTPVGATSRL